jgi:hypothetical protein
MPSSINTLTRSGFEKLSKQELLNTFRQITHDIEFVNSYPDAQKLFIRKLELLIERTPSR